jgi:hypothetical protein
VFLENSDGRCARKRSRHAIPHCHAGPWNRLAAIGLKYCVGLSGNWPEDVLLTRRSTSPLGVAAEWSVGIAQRNFVRDASSLFVNQAVGRENHGTSEAVRLAGKIADFAAGFLDQENTRGGVPTVKAEFPESLEATGGDTREIERGGTIAANSVGAEREIPVVMNIGAGLSFVRGEAGAQQTGRERFNLGDVNGLAIQCGASATGGGEKFIVDGVVNDTRDHRIALGKRDRNAEARVAVREIRGAIERIDMPAKLGGAFVAGSLLGGDGVVGEIFREPLDDRALGAFVGLGDQVGFSFVDDVRRSVELLAKDFTGVPGDFDGGFEIVFRHERGGTRCAIKMQTTRASVPLYHSRGLPGTGQIAARMRAMRRSLILLFASLTSGLLSFAADKDEWSVVTGCAGLRLGKGCFALRDPVDGKFLLLYTDDGEHWKELPRHAMPAALLHEGAFAASNSSLALCGDSELVVGTGGPAARVFHSADSAGRGTLWRRRS